MKEMYTPIVSNCTLSISSKLYKEILNCPIYTESDTLFSPFFYRSIDIGKLQDINDHCEPWTTWKSVGVILGQKIERIKPIINLNCMDELITTVFAGLYYNSICLYIANISDKCILSASVLGSLSVNEDDLHDDNRAYNYMFSIINMNRLSVWTFSPKTIVFDSAENDPYLNTPLPEDIKEIFETDYRNGASDYFLEFEYEIENDGTIKILSTS